MYTYAASITKIIDGDTYVCDIDLGFGIFLQQKHVRVAHINCPELRTLDGKNARAYVCDWLDKKPHVIVKILQHKSDKYGRILADVMFDYINVGSHLIAKGLAVPYDPA
jgi:endonuclease YncB( thermonuclease family)